ncbi:vesicle transport through interaction with t-SNAREs homolog 1B isoform X2 [Schistocerca gregaria]|uniref:vesicle transport through interaction with t-SNAREs homolog 1B isoform X2 n=1 Tax=Schistocerca gregaria TaxID=7010 RepID=UPI00211DAA7A|nr:vesicle transport through interaction with t-SNAREs homolog 1B isoform X2 [Schistocerca gregaria]
MSKSEGNYKFSFTHYGRLACFTQLMAIAAETETLGGEVIAELGEQRESLLRSKRRLAETDDELTRSRSLMHKIACHAIKNKAILIILIVLEVAILSSIVYMKWFRK